MQICGKDIAVQGRLLRIACLAAEGFEFVDDPEATLMQLRASRARIDLFTFMQRLPQTSPMFSYAMEQDNVAALPISSRQCSPA